MSRRRYIQLSPSDLAVLKSTGEAGMLTDIHIDKFGDILEQNTPYRMQSTLLLQMPELIRSVPKNEPCLQILFHGPRSSGHWICVWYDTEVLHVYDSANERVLHEEYKTYLAKLLPYENIRVVFEKVQLRTNYWDCGVFSIAFAISIVLGDNPCNLVYDISKMRPYLIGLFEFHRVIQFPLVQANSQPTESVKNIGNTWTVVSRQREADRKRTSRAMETEEQRVNRLKTAATYKSEKRESLESSLILKVEMGKREADRKRKSRAMKTEEQRVNRLNTAATYKSEKRKSVECSLNLKVEMGAREADRKRKSRAMETEEQHVNRLKTAATYKSEKRKSVECSINLKAEMNRKRQSRANESEEQRINRLESSVSYKKRKATENTNKPKYLLTKFAVSSRTKGVHLHTVHGESALIANSDFTENEIELNYLGQMNHSCQFCDAKHFILELPTDKKYSMCCHKGKVRILEDKIYPEPLKKLFTGRDPYSENFMANVRSYNNSVAFASFGAKLDSLKGSRGPFVFRICGQTYHNTYALHPDANEARKYEQLYIIDNEIATRVRMQHPGNAKCLPEVLSILDDILRRINPYAEAFKMMHEMEADQEKLSVTSGNPVREVRMWLKRDDRVDKNRFNLPTCNEIAVVFVAEDGNPPVDRDICVYSRNEGAISMPCISKHVDPMIYPLMFPHGETGWMPRMKQSKGERDITALQYNSYKLSDRGKFNPCLSMGKLTQQYIVDMWTKFESNRLYFMRNPQSKLRSEMYKGVIDYLHNKAGQDNAKIGKMVILPSSFGGSPRALQQSLIDAMTLFQNFGKPDLFTTMTCNPMWKEVTENLNSGQNATDRPDIIARVFQQKVRQLKSELIDKKVFGQCAAFVYVIEFQKRGLPHMHMLFFLDEEYKVRDADSVDRIVSAEIPDKFRYPMLYNIVKQCMVHGPCGQQNLHSPCMDSTTNLCTKRFPKDYVLETNYNSVGYPSYRRRDNGNMIIFDSKKDGIRRVADNRYVVPYNPYLLLKFNCHINVEICSTVQCIKYLFKYCYKGHDCAVIELKDAQENNHVKYDEVDDYISTRYVCPPEAMHRLYEYPMNEQSHAIYRLAVHAESEHLVYFQEGFEAAAVEKMKDSTLLAWFDLNKTDTEARKYLYCDIPNYYVFDKKHTKWTKRKNYVKPVLSRMYFVSPKETEHYYHRMLLLHVRGAQSFQGMKTYDGVVYPSFLETAIARRLVTDDEEWDKCLAEGSHLKFLKEMCRLFAYTVRI